MFKAFLKQFNQTIEYVFNKSQKGGIEAGHFLKKKKKQKKVLGIDYRCKGI